MKDHKWFWMTLGAWCFMAVVGAWALIFSPFHPRPEAIAEFAVKINGTDEKNQVWVSDGSIQLSLEGLTQEWESEGWKRSTRRFNLAPAFLNIPPEGREALAQIAQLRVFEKNHIYRLLGAVNDSGENKTYGWTAEFSQTALQNPNPSKTDFPLKPPAGASDVLNVEFGKMAVCSWSLPLARDPESQLQGIYTSQGFSGRLFTRQGGESVYLLQRGSLKLMAVVQTVGEKNTISVVKLDKI